MSLRRILSLTSLVVFSLVVEFAPAAQALPLDPLSLRNVRAAGVAGMELSGGGYFIAPELAWAPALTLDPQHFWIRAHLGAQLLKRKDNGNFMVGGDARAYFGMADLDWIPIELDLGGGAMLWSADLSVTPVICMQVHWVFLPFSTFVPEPGGSYLSLYLGSTVVVEAATQIVQLEAGIQIPIGAGPRSH